METPNVALYESSSGTALACKSPLLRSLRPMPNVYGRNARPCAMPETIMKGERKRFFTPCANAFGPGRPSGPLGVAHPTTRVATENNRIEICFKLVFMFASNGERLAP